MSSGTSNLFKGEISRIITVNIIPGFIASIPFILAIQKKYPGIGTFLQTNTEVLLLLVFIVSYAIGTILEDLGSNIEGYYCDRLVITKIFKNSKTVGMTLEKSKEEFETNWNQYLKLNFKNDTIIIGHKFITAMVTRLKFELTVGLAILVCLAGLMKFENILSIKLERWEEILLALVSIFLIFFESPKTAYTLYNSRKNLV